MGGLGFLQVSHVIAKDWVITPCKLFYFKIVSLFLLLPLFIPLTLSLSFRQKDLTAYNIERIITILGTIDNCKKAESLISVKLRTSYESDMNQFMLSIVS